MIKNFFITAWRNILKDSVHTLLNITGLAIGIAVCLIIGIWLHRELSFDNFHPNGSQIFRLTNTFKSESESFSQAPSGPAFGAQLPRQLPAIKSACRLFRESLKIKAGNNEFFEPQVLVVDSNFFQFFGFELVKGNAAQVLQSTDKIVLTEEMAAKYFGNENPVGKIMLIDGRDPMTVTGVAKNPPVHSHIQFDFLIPAAALKKMASERWDLDIDNLWVGGWPYTYVQLTEPDKRKEAEAAINRVAFTFSEKAWKENKMSYAYHLQPLRDIHLKSALRYDANNNGSLARVKVFSIVGIIILLLACINYINLTTAGAIRRAKETAVRKVVGAMRQQLIRQFFTETFIICAIAVALGVVLLKLVLPFFSRWLEQEPYAFPLSFINILILLGFVLAVSFLSGLYPAAILSSFNPALALKGNFSQSKGGNLLRKSLVVFQFTITIGLIAAILVISLQMRYIQNKSLGYNGNAVVEVDFNGDSTVLARYGSLRNELLRHPSILNISKHSQNVVGGLGNGWTTTENLQGEEISTSLYQFSVDTSYFDTYNMKLAAGRFFSGKMLTDTTKAVLVNEAAVKTFGWQNPEKAIGKRFGKGENIRYVIGVVKDFHFESLHKPVEALLMGYSLQGNKVSLKIKESQINEALTHLEKTWKRMAPNVPLEFEFVDEKIKEQYGNEQRMKGLFYVFAGLSLFIACLGLFGLSTFVVKRKIKEIGVRKVLGASVSGIVGLLSKDFLKLVLVAFLIAAPLSWYFMNQWLADFAYRIHISWWVYVVAGALALLIALVTVSFQSLKAALTNPVKNLRTE